MIPSVRFDEINTRDTYIYFTPNIWVPFFARWRLTNDSRKNKRFFLLRDKCHWIWQQKIDYIWIASYSLSNHTTLLLMFVAEKVLLLLVISLTVKCSETTIFGHVDRQSDSKRKWLFHGQACLVLKTVNRIIWRAFPWILLALSQISCLWDRVSFQWTGLVWWAVFCTCCFWWFLVLMSCFLI